MRDRLGIEFISVMGQPPVDFVRLAADLGVRHIGLAPQPIVANPHDYPAWSLLQDMALRKEMKAALAETGVSISLGEGFLVRPGSSMRDNAPSFDLMAELGAAQVNVACIEQDQARSFDEFAIFAEMAAERDMDSTLEFAPIMGPRDLPGALAALAHVGNPRFRLLVDMLHVARSNTSVADLAAIPPGKVGYIQLCDALPEWTMQSYADEARNDRLCPGDGDLPLVEMLAALPRTSVVGLELPMLAKAQAGLDPKERLGPCVAAARSLLDRVERVAA